MRVIYSEPVNGVTKVRNWGVVGGIEAAALFVKNFKPGVGKQFWAFNDADVPPGTVIAVDMQDAPISTADVTQNQALIEAIPAGTAAQVLVF